MKIAYLQKLIAIVIVFFWTNSFAQESYVVKGKSLNLRTGPSLKAEILGKIPGNMVVSVINTENPDWWFISYFGNEGYASAALLIPIEEAEQYVGWTKQDMGTGDKPDCENIIPNYDYDLDNELIIHASNVADVVVKLMKSEDECIRIAYIRSGDDFSMKNIPEGIYLLKLAYGQDFRKNIIDDKCVVKFMRNPTYERGTEKLDFYKIKKPNKYVNGKEYENWQVPSFELSLNVVYSKDDFHEFLSNKISEKEFNR